MKVEEIRSLVKIMEEAGLTSLEVADRDERVKLEKRPPRPAPTEDPPGRRIPEAMEDCGKIDGGGTGGPVYQEIKSPMVGVFYLAPSPGSKPFVEVGSTIRKGDTVCVIEAMKLMNEVSSDRDGKVAEICAESGSVVEYGQTLFKIS